MHQKSFTDSLSDALPGLHRYFYYHLSRNRNTADVKQDVEDLIQVTTLKAFLNSKKKSLAKYSNISLLSIKAKNELANFYLKSRTKNRLVAIDSSFELVSPDPDPFERLVLRESITRLKDRVAQEHVELLLDLLDDQGYRQLAAKHNLTEAALKMRICRLRKRIIKSHFYSCQ